MKKKEKPGTDIVPKEDVQVLDNQRVAPLLDVQDDPENALKVAQKYTKVLVNIIEGQKLYSMIQKRKYIRVEGWTALAGMVGVFPHTVYAKRLERGNYEVAYEAMVELKNINGQIIARADAFCSDQEPNKKDNPEYAIKSMAITRATGKACRLAFSWIIALAGYETTPAEEMDGIKDPKPRYQQPTKGKTQKQTKENPAKKQPLTIAQATVIVQNMIGSHLTHNFEKWRWAKSLFDGLTKYDASQIIFWWLGDQKKKIKGERIKRTEIERQDENGEALNNFLDDCYKKYQTKYPDDIKKYSHYCGLNKKKLPFDILDIKSLMKAYLEYRQMTGLDEDGNKNGGE